MRCSQSRPAPSSSSPPSRTSLPTPVPLSQPIGSASSPTPSRRPNNGRPASSRAEARTVANSASNSPRAAFDARSASASLRTDADNPDPDRPATCQHAASARRPEFSDARAASSRRPWATSPPSRAAARAWGHGSGSSPRQACSSAKSGGWPARSSADRPASSPTTSGSASPSEPGEPAEPCPQRADSRPGWQEERPGPPHSRLVEISRPQEPWLCAGDCRSSGPTQTSQGRSGPDRGAQPRCRGGQKDPDAASRIHHNHAPCRRPRRPASRAAAGPGTHRPWS